ncbi:MAG: glutamate racemase [Endomicrobiia bacterium]
MKKIKKSELPIGIFDSGLGGLTVVKEIINLLPNEDIIYLGDTARVPYGSKSKETIIKYSIQNTKFLLKHNIKLLVVACNTSSSYAVEKLKKDFKKLHIIEVVTPGAKTALKTTKNYKIGVIGTKATIKSRSYEKIIKKLCKKAKVYMQATPLFVPLIEEGWVDEVYKNKKYTQKQRINNKNIIKQVAIEYLKSLKKQNIDVLVLGCTHYPAIKMILQDIVGNKVKIVDSAVETSKEVKEVLIKNNLLNSKKTGKIKFYVTDDPQSFKIIGSMLLNKKIQNVKKIEVSILEK